MLYNPRHVGEKIKLVKKNWKIKKKNANIHNFEMKPLDCVAWLSSSLPSFLGSIRLQTMENCAQYVKHL